MTPDQVLDRFSIVVGVPAQHLTGPARAQRLSRLRAECCWHMRELTNSGLAGIGRIMGRHPATIHEAINSVRRAAEKDEQIRQRLEMVAAALQQDIMGRDVRSHAAAAVLADTTLSDADARQAALTLLRNRHAVASHA